MSYFLTYQLLMFPKVDFVLNFLVKVKLRRTLDNCAQESTNLAPLHKVSRIQSFIKLLRDVFSEVII